MNLDEDKLIEGYLSNNLTEAEHNDFVSRLKSDAVLRSKLRLEKQLQESFDQNTWSFVEDQKSTMVDTYIENFKSEEIQQLKKELAHTNKQYKRLKKTRVIRMLSYASAAVVALLIVFNTFSTRYTSQELYDETIDLSSLPSFVSREDANENQLVKAQLLFEEKAYDKAAVIFKKELGAIQHVKNANVYLYLGISQMEIDDFENAEVTFDKLIASDFIDAEKGKWYKALLYLKVQRIEESKVILNEIVAANSYNAKKASILLKNISKIKND